MVQFAQTVYERHSLFHRFDLRHDNRIFEEYTEKSHGGQLQGIAKTGEVPTLEVDPFKPSLSR